MLRLSACAALALWPHIVSADVAETDVNIVTAIDISDSVDRAQRSRALVGLAAAVRSPAFLSLVRNGQQRRVGFAVFAWHHGSFPVVVGWRLIGDAEDAETVARELEARIAVDVTSEARTAQQPFYIGRLTDTSGAIEHASELLGAAPFATGRAVINILGEGKDNVGDDPGPARDRLVAAGATINGVVFGADLHVAEYFRSEVTGGPGAFVLTAQDDLAFARMMERKFLLDLIAVAAP
jgi:hypothetical protein